MATPTPQEKEQAFVSRAMVNTILVKEYPDQRQRAAVCYAQLSKHKATVAEGETPEYDKVIEAIEDDVLHGKGVLRLDLSKATTTTTCDYCGERLGGSYNENPDTVSLHLPQAMAKQNGEIYSSMKHFCGTGCLAGHLQDVHEAAGCMSDYAKASEHEAFARDISYKERKHLKSGQFLDPARRSFPIENCKDVAAAVHAWGRYRGSMSFEEFKAKLTRKAHALGCSLPEKWTKK